MITLTTIIPEHLAGKRLDQALAELFPEHSRSRLQKWIKDGQVQINQTILRQRDKIEAGQNIVINAEIAAADRWEAQDIPLDIIYEDDYIIIINKPVGLVVHPAAGNLDSTLLNALLYHAPQLAQLPRAGIVHRLDKDTSGLMVVAKTLSAHTHLVAELQARHIKREYTAVVEGIMTAGGTVDAPIGRHPQHRIRMAVVSSGKPAVTHYRVIERFSAHTWIKLQLETGRTHQIRVHMAHIRQAIVGDQTYAGRFKLPKNAIEETIATLRGFKRQALHAIHLELEHPVTKELLGFDAPIPEDMQNLIDALRNIS